MLTRILRLAPRALVMPVPQADAKSEEANNYRNLILSSSWWGFVDGGIFNYLPVFLARLGASASVVGLVTSGPALAGILTYVPGGVYAERHKDLVKVVVGTGLIMRFSYLLIALLPFFVSPAYLPIVAVIIWSLFMIPNSIGLPAWTAVLQQAVPLEHRAQLNGTRWALFSLVSAIAIAVFGFMLDRTPFPAGYQLVFVISFMAGMLYLYYFNKIRVPPFARDPSSAPPKGLADQLRSFFRPLAESPGFVRFTAATLPYRLAFSLPVALFSIYWVDNLHASNAWIGLRGTVGYATLVVGYRLWGQIANRVGHRQVLLISGGISVLYPVLTALAPSPAWLLPGAVIWGLAVSGLDIGLFDMLLATCPPGRQPSYAATSNMLVSGVTFLAPFLGALLARAIGVQAALLWAGAFELVTAAGFWFLPTREQEGLA